MIGTILRRLLLVVAVPIECVAAIFGRETGFGNKVMDRKVGDPTGKLLQTREQALAEQRRKQQRLDRYD